MGLLFWGVEGGGGGGGGVGGVYYQGEGIEGNCKLRVPNISQFRNMLQIMPGMLMSFAVHFLTKRYWALQETTNINTRILQTMALHYYAMLYHALLKLPRFRTFLPSCDTSSSARAQARRGRGWRSPKVPSNPKTFLFVELSWSR